MLYIGDKESFQITVFGVNGHVRYRPSFLGIFLVLLGHALGDTTFLAQHANIHEYGFAAFSCRDGYYVLFGLAGKTLRRAEHYAGHEYERKRQ